MPSSSESPDERAARHQAKAIRDADYEAKKEEERKLIPEHPSSEYREYQFKIEWRGETFIKTIIATDSEQA